MALCVAAAEVLAPDQRSVEDSTAFVGAVLEKLRIYHVNRSRLDWPSVERAAFEKARAAKSRNKLYEIVDGVLQDLGEPHSFLVRPRSLAGAASATGDAPAKTPAIRSSVVAEDVGYIELPTFAGTDASAVAFARATRAALLAMDKAPLCGWIVDLRSNEGGNMHAALLGLGAVVGQGRLGSVEGGAIPQYWHYHSNRMFVSSVADIGDGTGRDVTAPDGSPVVRGIRQTFALAADSAEVRQFELPVAVLIGNATMSSGEGVAVSFIGRPLAKTFGAPTRGRSSANVGFKLAGGEMLIVTYGRFADRNGAMHSPSVIPDVETEWSAAPPSSSDEAVASAARWIHGLHMCSARLPP
jgi:carboxyl-terminal processing protease